MHDISPLGCVTGVAALGLVWVSHVLAPLIGGLVAIGKSRLNARLARASDAAAAAGTERPLAPGWAAIHGPLEYAPGEQLAVTVAIEQVGTEHKTKHGFKHRWTEVKRRVNAAPFYVKDRRGTTVRVEPDEHTILVDELDRVTRHNVATRERFAELTPGEVVYVLGELRPGHDPTTGGYRGTETTLVMKPPANGRLLVSSEELGDRFRREARAHRTFALAFLGMLALVGLLDMGLHFRMFAGHVEAATVVNRVLIPGKGSHCELVLRTESGDRITESATTAACAGVYAGDKVALTVVGNKGQAALGSAPAINGSIVVIAALALGIAVVLYRLRVRAWYEKKVVDKGEGKLDVS